MTSEMFIVLLLFLTTDRQVGKEHALVQVLLQMSPGRQLRAMGELLVCAGLCQVATKRTTRAWVRWGKRFNFSPSLRHTPHDKEQIGILENICHKDLSEESQKEASFSHDHHNCSPF